ncbi:MAG: response regulator, partial [Ideonella sp.]
SGADAVSRACRGFAARMARSGVEALECLQENEYALLLTDLRMPEMDGYELAAAVRAAETGVRRMPIVALTGDAFVNGINRWVDAGMDDCLVKPVRLAALKAMLSTFVPDPPVSPASADRSSC